jgi:hypothetical protein
VGSALAAAGHSPGPNAATVADAANMRTVSRRTFDSPP